MTDQGLWPSRSKHPPNANRQMPNLPQKVVAFIWPGRDNKQSITAPTASTHNALINSTRTAPKSG